MFKKLNKSEAELVNHVYLKLDNGFVYRISKGSKAISPDPEKEQITTIVANMEPVTQEEIESVFGEEYDSLTIDKNVTLTYRYKKSDKKNLLLLYGESGKRPFYLVFLAVRAYTGEFGRSKRIKGNKEYQ
ncbi:hypothetical protein EDM57_07435 [Brevibacillus gelatini]|uniref:Uncharacterized protein n=1 Tax=Brevibacillus gelatini TaxID=1655277 RepID=A0A3M8B536_9BACL|nr:hypothetical protein [Brevibacillus gelatini]RNB58548.1 hypothetical protein EDM57_07435 [Brevibacillus gelatini]